MIRFQPDTWRDALLRPLAMAAPDSGVYVEIMAPDLRFAALALLTLAALVLLARGRSLPRPLKLLLALVWLAFVPWLATTGNGRYFLPVLLVVGPLALGLVHVLPLSRSLRLALAVLLVATQAAVVWTADPHDRWSLAYWRDRYFAIELTPQERAQPATYVTLSSISYSLVAPQFHPASRWISIASLSGNLEHAPDDRRAQAFLQQAASEPRPLQLLVPAVLLYMDASRQPNAEMRAELNRRLSAQLLGLAPGDCRLLRSSGLFSGAEVANGRVDPALADRIGFWVCPLQYPVARPPAATPVLVPQVEQAFRRMEQACPRFFRPGEAQSVRLPDGYVRTYPSADTKVYVLDDGNVYYRYWRALNMNHAGTRDQVLAEGFRLDCNTLKGRSGLPWERSL